MNKRKKEGGLIQMEEEVNVMRDLVLFWLRVGRGVSLLFVVFGLGWAGAGFLKGENPGNALALPGIFVFLYLLISYFIKRNDKEKKVKQ